MAATTSPSVIDVTALLGCDVVIFCPTQDVLFTASATNTTSIVTGTQSASTTALVADRAPAGFGKRRTLVYPFLIVQLVAGSANVTVKPV